MHKPWPLGDVSMAVNATVMVIDVSSKRRLEMKILNSVLLLTLFAAGAAVAQGDRGANTTPTGTSSTFSWQQQQRREEEVKEKYASQFAGMSDAK